MTRPNVVWILSDQHNARCTSWGVFPVDVRTPNLERLADEGIRFSRAFSQSPLCTPSRMSFLSGQYPLNHGYYGLGGPGNNLPPSLLAMLRQEGYRTGAIGKIHTPDRYLENDVDVLHDVYGGQPQADGESSANAYLAHLLDHDLTDASDYEYLPEWRDKDEKFGDRGRRPTPVRLQAGVDARPSELPFEHQPEYWSVERAREFIDDGDEPFALWLSFPRPHQPYTPAKRFWDEYDETELAFPPNFEDSLTDKPSIQRRLREWQRGRRYAAFDPDDYESVCRRKLQGYLGCVSMVDACVGAILDHLDARGIRDDTIVIYSADHGEFATEHGFLEKAPGISYDAVSRIPFVWSWPAAFRSGEVCDELVESVDLVPTLRSIVSGEAASSADGEDISGLLTGEDTSPVREFAITENPWAKSIRTKHHRLTYYPSGYFGVDTESYLECYDLEADPWEMTNVATDPAQADRIDKLRRDLYEWLVKTKRPITTLPSMQSGRDSTAKYEYRLGDDGTTSPVTVARYLEENEGGYYL